MALAAVVLSAVVCTVEVTTMASSIFAPRVSSTTIPALPEAPGEMLGVDPVTDTVATPALLLLAAYGGAPPPTVKLDGPAPLAMVMLLGAVVNSACDVADPTVTAIATCVPVASITRTCAVPAVCLAVMASVFQLTLVTTDAVLLLLLK